MNESQGYSAEYAAMSHEIYSLNKQLEEKDRKYRESVKTDLLDPFRNPTEFRWYRDDYSEILPWATMPEFSVPYEPAGVEKSAIRRFYNIGGFTMLIQFFASGILAAVLIFLIKLILLKTNSGAADSAIEHYMRRGSIYAAINLITYLAANVGFTFLSLKWAKIKPSFMIQTRDYHLSDAVQYFFAAVFIWYSSAIIAGGIENIFEKYGFSTQVLDMDMAKTGLGFAVFTIYACMIAPLTEELFFRGAMMKIFSKSNQRFGIFISAFFFGLAHSNLPQFVPAFLLGIFLGHIDMKHNSIIPSIVVHIMINTLATVYSELGDNQFLMGAFGLFLLVCWFVGLIMLIIFRMNCRLPVSTPAQSRRGIAIAKTSIGVILAVAVHIAYMTVIIYNTRT